jgi:hypothetical protein
VHGADEPARHAFVKTISFAAGRLMNPIKPESQTYALKRWMRADAHLFVRPDWRRYVAVGSEAESLFELYERKYRPDQARVPAGSREGGQWTDDEGGSGETGDDGGADNDVVTDVFGEPYYQPGGHHEMPRSIYEKWDLRPETRAVFDRSTTGSLPPGRVRTSPDSDPQGHFWDRAHRDYTDAIKELTDRYFERNRIGPPEMTPDQAREVLKEIRDSKDPRIRNYSTTIRAIRRFYRFRGGRE